MSKRPPRFAPLKAHLQHCEAAVSTQPFSVRNIACIALRPQDQDAGMSLPRWTIPGGRYARRMIADYYTRIPSIGEAFAQMRCRPNYDASRPCVEYYRSRHDIYVMVPIV
jgi:DNA gyrase inhibitor GyrI